MKLAFWLADGSTGDCPGLWRRKKQFVYYFILLKRKGCKDKEKDILKDGKVILYLKKYYAVKSCQVFLPFDYKFKMV